MKVRARAVVASILTGLALLLTPFVATSASAAPVRWSFCDRSTLVYMLADERGVGPETIVYNGCKFVNWHWSATL